MGPPQDTSTTTVFGVTVTSTGTPSTITLDTSENLKQITTSVGSTIYLHRHDSSPYSYTLFPASGIVEPVEGTVNLPINDFAVLRVVGTGTLSITVSKHNNVVN